jgi:peptidyl-prolyl cis-trans isomerase B (cyclophilin B)
MAREQVKTHDIPADKLQSLTRAVMTTSKGDITIDLFPKEAPNTVANFYTLASDGFYDGLAFHRVIPGFVAQGGCPEGTGAGGPGWVIACETKGNPHKHKTGSLSMAHRGKDTGGSQFFLVLAPQPHLDGLHTVFGQVSGGLDVMQDLEMGDEIKSVKFTDH